MHVKVNNIVNIYNDYNYDIKNFNELAIKILNLLAIKLKQNLAWCVAVIFNDELTSQQLNKTYRQKDYVPDVLSFANDNNVFFFNEIVAIKELGDIYICYPQAIIQANLYGHSLNRELSFLFLHGLLHTLGYNHIEVEAEKIMFGLQTEILNELNITRK